MTLDRLGQRYGVRPSSLLRGSVEDLALDCLCASVGASDSYAALPEKATLQAVVVIG